MNKLMANPWIAQVPTYEPGRPLEEVARDLGLNGIDDIVKLASNENVLGPSPLAMEAMHATVDRMHLYPDGGSFYLREALAKHFDLSPSNVLPGNGSNELIELLGHVFLGPETEIVMSECAFVIYKLIAMLFQARVKATPMRDFTHDLEAMREAVTKQTRLVFVANPNNPTGTKVDSAALDKFIRSMPDHVLVVLDEAYVELLPDQDQLDTTAYIRDGYPVCILRTFSKAYGLAGLRLGYALADEKIIQLLHAARQPFNVNYMAQVAAVAALDDVAHLEATQQMVQRGLDQITSALNAANIKYIPSCVNFLLVRVGDGRQVFQALQRAHVIVRPMDGYGLPEYVRVTIGLPEENERFLNSLFRILEGKGA